MNCVWVMCGLIARIARSGRGKGVELGGDEAGSIVLEFGLNTSISVIEKSSLA